MSYIRIAPYMFLHKVTLLKSGTSIPVRTKLRRSLYLYPLDNIIFSRSNFIHLYSKSGARLSLNVSHISFFREHRCFLVPTYRSTVSKSVHDRRNTSHTRLSCVCDKITHNSNRFFSYLSIIFQLTFMNRYISMIKNTRKYINMNY